MQQAAALITPHEALAHYAASHYSAHIEKLAWTLPCVPSPMPAKGRAVLFPASTLARKGAFEMRTACERLGFPLHVLGQAAESENFWHACDVRAADPVRLFDGIGCVALPAFVEHQPRILLRALAAGLPVVCTPQCGLPSNHPQVFIIDAGDTAALVARLNALQHNASITCVRPYDLT